MLRLTCLDITNIRSIDHLTVNVDPNGTTALFGPSGVGKSGILDALPWCLWGDTGTAGSASGLRREGTFEPAQVTATVLIGDAEVIATRRITRSDSGNETASARMWVDGVRQRNITPATLTKTITQMTGLNAKTFRAAFYMAQGRLTDLITGTAADVQQTFEELTGLDDLAKRIKSLRDQYKEASIRADALPGDPETVASTEKDAEAARKESGRIQKAADGDEQLEQKSRTAWESAAGHAQDLHTAERAAAASRQEQATAAAMLDEAVRAVDAARRDVGRAGGESGADDVEAARQAAVDAVSDAEAQVALVTRHGADLAAVTDRVAAARAAAEEARREQRSASEADLDAAVGHAESAVHASRLRLDAARQDAAVSQSRAEERDDAVRRLSHATDTATCPTCRQRIADIESVITDLRTQRDHERQRAEQCKNAADSEAGALTGAERDLAQARDAAAHAASLTRVAEHAEQSVNSAVDAQTAATTALRGLLTQLGTATSADTPEKARAAALDAHTALSERVQRLRAQADAWTALQSATTRHAEAEQRQGAADSSVLDGPTHDDVAAAESSAATARAALDDAQAVAARSASDAKAARATAMQLAGIADDAAMRWKLKQDAANAAEESRIARDVLISLRRDLLTEYCDAISASATDVLVQLGGEHVAFRIDETFAPTVVLPDGTTRPTRQLSGGEKARAAVCAFIGFSRQLAGGGLPGMIFADEITAAQDEVFRRELLTMLRSLTMPLIVVSHTADVLDIASRVIRLERAPLGTTQIVP